MAGNQLWIVLYDSECEVCQAGIAWLRLLDPRHLTDPRPIDEHPPAKLTRDDCLRELHVVAPNGSILRGAPAVAQLARLSPITWILGALASIPPLSWMARSLYRALATRRYALSKCRGGRCRVPSPQGISGAFWTCYAAGLIVRLPIIWFAGLTRLGANLRDYFRTRRRRIDLLDGRLSLLFLGGWPCDLIPAFFGERFTMVLYRGLAIDPGSPKMRASLARHLARLEPHAIRAVVVTHHHEEHAGNLDWLCDRTGAPLIASPATTKRLRPPTRLPWIRAVLIGQPATLAIEPLPAIPGPLPFTPELQILPAPGHSDDHIAIYHSAEELLIAGDSFMGAYFSTPNPDVDSRKWIETLERFLALDIEILVEGHGHIHTLRHDIPNIPGVVIREDPRAAIHEKLEFLRWVRTQIEDGRDEALPARLVEATCFPWGQRYSWENFATDEATRLFSSGHFSRTELVRSFVRNTASVLPSVYEVKFRR